VNIETIAVIGAGTMGHGIAQVAGMAGFETRLTDVSGDARVEAWRRIQANLAGGVSRGKLTQAQAETAASNIALVPNVETAVEKADLVVEAVVEDLATKQALFQQLDRLVSQRTILASNTSSLAVTRIANATAQPGRVLGLHFFNPVHLMKLVEVVTHDACAPDTIAAARAVAERMGKTTIVVRDAPGFASSRLGVVLGLEAMRMLEEGVASAADIDTAMELGYGHPMGPLRLTDLVGLDVRLRIAEYLHAELGDRFKPPRILSEKVRGGELGKKAGKGFYEW
jgi:3-hydroxybutyryl-CoA dehydrogenase